MFTSNNHVQKWINAFRNMNDVNICINNLLSLNVFVDNVPHVDIIFRHSFAMRIVLSRVTD